MACYYPRKGYRSKSVNPSGKRSIVFNLNQGFRDLPVVVPCGQCIGCRLEHSRQWAMRLVHEKSLHETSCFITLTYATENLPKDNSLRKRDFQLFMKKLRKWLAHKRIRFFHCGEYGENFGRPHYHAIIFGHDWSDKELKFVTKRGDKVYTSKKLEELWGLGLVSTAEVTFESAAYVARYVTKKVTGEKAIHHYNKIDLSTGEILSERSPEYVTMSRRPGIGKDWFSKYTSDVFPHDRVVLRGRKMKPPKYYSALYEIHYPEDYARVKALRLKAAKKPEVQADNTHERLRVRETIQLKKLNEQLQRKLK